MEQWFEQVFFFPSATTTGSAGVVLSCGIHGDETGPIHLIQTIHQLLVTGHLQTQRPLLLIYGNPNAIRDNKRYVDFNLNRLFGPTFHTGAETLRAGDLMSACSRFQRQVGHVACHLDLHSTIKPSLIERFALRPINNRCSSIQWGTHLVNAGFGGLVQQSHRTQTFAQFTCDSLGCDSFTLECGSHSQPDITQFEALKNWILTLLADPSFLNQQASRTTANSTFKHFVVKEDIIKTTSQFKFLIDERTPNFTLLPIGTDVYEDKNGILKTSEARYTLFLNNKVEIGQRAGLLLSNI